MKEMLHFHKFPDGSRVSFIIIKCVHRITACIYSIQHSASLRSIVFIKIQTFESFCHCTVTRSRNDLKQWHYVQSTHVIYVIYSFKWFQFFFVTKACTQCCSFPKVEGLHEESSRYSESFYAAASVDFLSSHLQGFRLFLS